MYQQTAVIYTAHGFEGVGVRFRQQINENSKMLCWHHVVPEMNHNEIVGWTNANPDMKPVLIRRRNEEYRINTRIKK